MVEDVKMMKVKNTIDEKGSAVKEKHCKVWRPDVAKHQWLFYNGI